MKIHILTFVILILLCSKSMAQSNIDVILGSIDNNNLTLKALRDEGGAQKYANKVGTTLANPEVEFAYLWGSSNEAGSKKDISVTQSFDFATILGYKGSVAQKENVLVDIRYKNERMNLLLEAKKQCYQAIYYNAIIIELDMRLQYAESTANAYKRKLDTGDANILEYNKAMLNLTLVKAEKQKAIVSIVDIMSELTRLNGGVALTLNDTSFDAIAPLPDFDTWYSEAETKSPILEYVKNDITLRREQIKLSKSVWYPTISAGYVSEFEKVDKFHGISLGISVPLWADKNKIKQAKAAVTASESRQSEAKIDFFYKIKSLYDKTVALQKSATEIKVSISQLNTTRLLDKALENGQISILDYIVEASLYYDAIQQSLMAERDYYLSLAELSAFTL
ncbi:MAG: TolC family protein [Bacteroidales bacterium]